MEYVYITKNNLENRQHYQYSKFDGDAFLAAYASSRCNYIEQHKDSMLSSDAIAAWVTKRFNVYYSKEVLTDVFILKYELLKCLISLFNNADFNFSTVLDKIVKTFEVRKRLYHCYNEKMRPYDESDYTDIELYLLFSLLLIKSIKITNDLQYVSTLLKINDTLLSLDVSQKSLLSFICEEELAIITALKEEFWGTK